ncbi:MULTISPECIES: hypothetical protein [Hyphomicrobiales]|uniref:hypothetical protein n=1 Tax=Hyphomicrobiales TaxID=356 RepID=UPI003298E8A2
MRVNIEHGETQTGMFRKTTHYTVTVNVQFTEEEKHIIKQRKIGDAIVVERGVPSDRDARKFSGIEHVFNLTIDRLLKGEDAYAFSTPLEAKEYEQLLKDSLLNLKNYIVENEGVENKSTSFEL